MGTGLRNSDGRSGVAEEPIMAGTTGNHQDDLWTYRCPATHEGMSTIIRRHSTNPADVRQVALGNSDLSGVHRVLDLGCGFGFIAEAVAARVADDAHVTGVDTWQEDETPFIKRVEHAGRRAAFVRMIIGDNLPWDDSSFDLVVCSYALYFFPDIVAEVARVLDAGGLFITITHSEHGMVGELPDAGLREAAEGVLSLIRRFSAENGESQLTRSFGEVMRIDYVNALRFLPDDLDELFAYLRFKMPFLVHGSQPGDPLPENLARHAKAVMRRDGNVVINKTDAVFHCRRPLCH